MSVRTYIISLSLTGALAGLGCWIFMGNTASVEAAGTIAGPGSAKVAPRLEHAPSDQQRLLPKPKIAAPADPASPSRSKAAARNALPPPAVEPTTPEARAARVEQEANHELRRLVNLLNLDEAQQEKIFDSLARNSRYWSPEMQIAVPGAASTGKRGHSTDSAATTPGVFIPIFEAPVTVPDKSNGIADTPLPADTTPPSITIGATSPDASDNPRINDPMSEIMSHLTPDQQQALLEAESDRAAWWAEILPEILPADDVPNIDGSNGGTKDYEGSETLE